MTTTSDGTPPPGAGSEFPDTAPVRVPPLPGELPPPPPLLSHLQPEAQHPAPVPGDEQPPAGRAARRLPADTPSGAGRVILPIALCLVGVVALGAGWTHLEAERAAEAQEQIAAGPSAKPPVPSLGNGTPSSTPASSTSPSASPSASRPAPASPSRSASPSSVPSSSTSSAPATPVVDRSVPVVVLNATNRTGLAAAVAERLRAKGWTIAQVGNWRGDTVRLTTVFVTGNAQAAATMRRDVKAADGTLPTWPGMPKKQVVLVLGPDYPLVR